MKLYAIVTDGVNGPEPLFDSDTGAPSVYYHKYFAKLEVEELNRNAQGGYRYIEFETED